MQEKHIARLILCPHKGIFQPRHSADKHRQNHRTNHFHESGAPSQVATAKQQTSL